MVYAKLLVIMTLQEITDLYPEPYRTQILEYPNKHWRMDSEIPIVSTSIDNVNYYDEDGRYWSGAITMVINHERVLKNKLL